MAAEKNSYILELIKKLSYIIFWINAKKCPSITELNNPISGIFFYVTQTNLTFTPVNISPEQGNDVCLTFAFSSRD